MKKCSVLGLFFFFFTMWHQALAENAIYDPASKILTVPNVKIGDEQPLYDIEMQLQADGSLSIQNTQITDADDGDFLYGSNPVLIQYKSKMEQAFYHDQRFPVPLELNDVKLSSKSEKWNQEQLVGTWTDTVLTYSFYEDGTGEHTCWEVFPDPDCTESMPFNWSIDSYGNLLFGTLLPDNTYYRSIVAIISSSEDVRSITAYFREVKTTEDGNNESVREGIRDFYKK